METKNKEKTESIKYDYVDFSYFISYNKPVIILIYRIP